MAINGNGGEIMRKTEQMEIDGVMYKVRSLNISEIISIAGMDNPLQTVPYIVINGTISPKFKTVDDIPLNAVLALANKIQELTVLEMGVDDESLPRNTFIV